MDSSEFAGQVIRKSTQLAQELRDKIYVFEKQLEGPEFIPVLQSWMWKEYWLGVPPPAKQITLLPDQDVNIKLRLTRQILEEYKHYQIFARRVKRYCTVEPERAQRNQGGWFGRHSRKFMHNPG